MLGKMVIFVDFFIVGYSYNIGKLKILKRSYFFKVWIDLVGNDVDEVFWSNK